MRFLDFNDPFYRPLWRRVAITAICLIWGAVEFGDGEPFWGILFSALGAYAFWGFFIAASPDAGRSHEEDTR
ncbi:hypothetical protein C2I36_05985 [Rhodobacteraceae bacterium WD3A24]|nr:hypothetical protein C2I36_05985 [Rhodobacteraceae bacterium WD3A24]